MDSLSRDSYRCINNVTTTNPTYVPSSIQRYDLRSALRGELYNALLAELHDHSKSIKSDHRSPSYRSTRRPRMVLLLLLPHDSDQHSYLHDRNLSSRSLLRALQRGYVHKYDNQLPIHWNAS